MYSAPSGRCPFTDWFEGLKDSLGRRAINDRIARMELGNFGDSRDLRDGLWELRIDLGPGYRIYFSVISKCKVLLLLGGIKRTQNRDIIKAKKILREFKATSF